MKTILPLRGRVVIRPDKPKLGSGILAVPPAQAAWDYDRDKELALRARRSHRGVVLALGPPALSAKGVEVPYGFGVGDTVQYTWAHNEKEFTKLWTDGEPAAWIPQSLVLAVWEEDARPA